MGEFDWTLDAQGQWFAEILRGDEEYLFTVVFLDGSVDQLAQHRCSVWAQHQASRSEPVFRATTESARLGKAVLEMWWRYTGFAAQEKGDDEGV